MDNTKLQDEKWSSKGFVMQYSIIIVAVLIYSFIFYSLWVKYTGILHTVLELICIFIAVATFLCVWYTYNMNESHNKIIAFGFIVVAIFDIFHTYYFPSLNLYPPGYIDLATRYWLMGRFAEAVVILVITLNVFRLKGSKWSALFISLAIALGTVLITLYFLRLLPPLKDNSGAVTTPKIMLEYILIVLFAVSILNIFIKKLYKKRGTIVIYKYILMALLLAIPAELCFTIYKDSQSYSQVLGHLLKVVYYLCLFNGIMKNVIINPYKQLEQRNSFMIEILNQLPMGLAIYDKDKIMTFSNEKTLELIDAELDEIEGKEIKQILRQAYGQSEDIDRFINENSASDSQTLKNRMLTIKRKNNSLFKIKYDNYKLANGQNLLLLDDAGKDQELKDLQIQTQTILNSMKNSVMVTDRNNRIIMLNKTLEDIIGINSKDMLGMGLHEFRKRIGLNVEKEYYEHGMGDSRQVREISLTAADGTKKEMIHHSSPVFSINGDYIGSIGIFSDITHIKREQEKIRNQEKLALIGSMASGIIHEIKNPLAVIKGYSQLLKLKSKDEGTKGYAEFIESASADIERFIRSLLDLARPHPSEFRELSLNKLLEDISMVMKDYLASRNIKSCFKASHDERMISGDEDKLRQVVLNMISNAIEAMPDKKDGNIEVSTCYNEGSGEMILIVADNGKGMSKEQLSRIGTPFYTTKESGTGLGLSICYQIINELGGRIEVESELEKGTAFKIILNCCAVKDEDVPHKIAAY